MKNINNIGKIWGDKRKSLVTFSFCLVLFAGTALSCFAQDGGWSAWPSASPTPTSTPMPKPRATPHKPQLPTYTPPAIPYPAPLPTPEAKKKKARNTSQGPAEKTIIVDGKVSISLCVNSGTLKVNGWDHDEVRAYVDGGSSLGFRVKQDKKYKKVVGLQVLGFDPKEYKDLNMDECLEGKTIELDVPAEAEVVIKSNASNISADSIGKVRIENLSGNITLQNISNGVDVSNFEGNITAQEINGPISLFASTGAVSVFECRPIEINDQLKVKSRSGPISIKNVEHAVIDVSSATGSLGFTGSLEPGGQYSFNTTSGKIELNLPLDTSCKLIATYGGRFDLLLRWKDIIHDKQPGTQKVIALLGNGDATLTVTTYSGYILIKPPKK